MGKDPESAETAEEVNQEIIGEQFVTDKHR